MVYELGLSRRIFKVMASDRMDSKAEGGDPGETEIFKAAAPSFGFSCALARAGPACAAATRGTSCRASGGAVQPFSITPILHA